MVVLLLFVVGIILFPWVAVKRKRYMVIYALFNQKSIKDQTVNEQFCFRCLEPFLIAFDQALFCLLYK